MKKTLFFLLTLAALLPWAANAQQTLTVYDGLTATLTTNNYVPMYGGYFDDFTKSEFVIPAEKLSDMTGGEISAIKFYIASVGTDGSGWDNTHQVVFLKEVESTTLSAYSGMEDATIVFDGMFTVPESDDQEFEINFTTHYQYEGGNLLIGIYNTADGDYRTVNWFGEMIEGASGGNSNGNSLDNISFTQKNFIPKTTFTYEAAAVGGCAKPGAITLGTAGATEFPISWTAGGTETSWNVYLTQGGTPVDGYNPLVVNNTNCTFTGLTAVTTYNVAIEAICGSEVSNQRTTSFTTAMCNASDMCEITFELTDSYGDGWNGNYIQVTDVLTNNVIGTFTNQNLNNTTGYGTNELNTINAKFCTGRELQFDYVLGGSNTYPSENSWVIKDANDVIIWEYSGPSSDMTLSPNYVTNCAPATCPMPADLTATLTPNNGSVATLSWTENGEATNWTLEYSYWDVTISDYNISTVSVSGTPSHELTNLISEELYWARVKAVCGGTEESEWTDYIDFQPTNTVEVSVNDGDDTHSFIPFYGLAVNNTPNASQFIIPAANLENINPGSTIKGMTLYSSTYYASWGNAVFQIRLKEVDENSFASTSFLGISGATNVFESGLYLDGNKVEISFDQDYTYNGGNLLVQFALTTSGTTSSVSWKGVNGSGNNALYTYMSGNSQSGPHLSTFLPKVTFRVIQAEITCDKAKDLAANDITHEQATITWTSDESAWQIAWSTEENFDPNTVNYTAITNEKTYTITGLQPLTDYYVHVRSKCGNDNGDWSTQLHFKTPCALVATYDSESFENMTDGLMPDCWTKVGDNNAQVENYTSNWAHTGNTCFYIYNGINNNNTSVVLTPSLSVEINTMQIDMFARPADPNNSNYGHLYVGYMTDASDATTFMAVKTLAAADIQDYIHVVVPMSSAPDGAVMAIKLVAGVGSWSFAGWYIDDVVIEPAVCPVPTGLYTAAVGADTAKVRWAAGGEETAWNLKYHAQGDNDWAEATAQGDSTFTFTQLTANTTYEWQVQAVCGANFMSEWSALGSFTTEAAPANGDVYELFSGDLEEGDYLIVYDGAAMNTTVSGDRLQYEEVAITNNVIETNNAAIVWHIAPSDNYWTIYNADANAYAASTGAKNKAQMLAGSNDDKAKWTVSGTSVYEFVNKQNTTNNVNANLRRNGTYGFACYATSTGGALSLYKKVDNTPSIALSTNSVEAPDAGIDGTITVTYNNIDLTNAPEVQFFAADGTTPATYNWLIADINNQNNVEYLIDANTGEARTAYFKVYGLDAQANDVYSELVTVSQAAYVAPPTPGTWVLTDLASITAQDTFVIVGTYQNDTYAMSNDKGTTAPPAPVSVTVVNNTLSAEPTNDIKWTVSGNATDGYTFYPNGSTSTWLYCTNTNNGVRVGGTNNSKTFKISNGYLKHDGTSRYVGIYNGQDWRCYTSTTGNIENQTFAFYMKDDGAVATTVTIDATGLTNTDVYTSTAAGTLSATVSANDAAIAGATVTWSSSDETVATIDNSGVVTLVAEGTTTITASYAGLENEYRSSSATYELVVTNSDPSGTYEDPYTVVEAIDATPSASWVYTRGIVSRFYGTNTSIDQDNSHRYYISDDGTTTSPEMLVYKGYGLNHASFTSADDLLVGDTIIIYGKLAIYNNTEEIAQDNYIVYLGRPVMQYHVSAIAADDNMGSVSGTVGNDPFASGDYAAGTQITLTATPAEGYDFSNWTKYAYPQGEEVSTNATYTFAVSEDIQLIAYFTPKVYNVTYELGQGAWVNGYYAPVTYTYGEGVTLPTAQNMEYENHTFGGWYDNAQFTGTPITEISTTAMGDTTLYAKWTIDTYEIALVQPSNGTISSDPAQTAAVGAPVMLTATPDEGYSFNGAWEVRNTTNGQTVDVVNNQFTMPAGNVEVHASFTLNSYDVIATVNPVDGGTITGAGTFSHGGVATLTATANEGYRFINWTSNQTEITTETSVAITVTSDTNLVANFQALEKVASPTFSPVAGTYTEPQTVTIACATPGAVIYYTTDGNEPTANSTQYTDGFELNANTTVKAIAMKDGNDWLPSDVATAEYTFNFPTYTVTFEPGNNGTVAQATMTGNAFTQAVDFANNNAIPAADCQTLGWSFVGWSTAAVQETTTAPTTLVTSPYSPTDNITLYAVYQQDNNAAVSSSVDFSTMGYSNQTAVTTVDINNTTTATFAKANGSTAPTYYTSGTAVRCYAKNTITISSQSAMTGITFTFGSDDGQNAITADEGAYSNGVWTGNATSVVFTIGGSNGHRRIATITVNQNGAVTTYNSNPECIITYPIELATVQNGTIEADKTEAAEGETVTLTATPAAGYHFGRWNVTKTATTSVENVTVTNNTFEMPASAVTVSADFWIDTLIILATPNPANGGTVTGEDEYEYGTQVTLTATPANDYYFTGWTSNGTQVSTDATFTFTATQDSDLVANFEAKQLVATPTFTPAAGSYTEPQTVTINCATQGATIYYTTDGTEPTANSTQYTDGFTLNANTTVKAIAVKDGEQWLPSEVATAAYTFNFPTYTVTFNPGNNGTVPEATMTGNQFTEPVDFTNNVPSPAAACTDWTFAGWSTAEVTETTTEPTFVTSPYNPSADITLYAVYQKTEQGTGAATPARYVKVTSAPNDWSGDYLIVCEGIWVAFDGSRSSLDANNNTIDVEINNGVIDSTATTGAAKFTIASMNTTTGYSIKSASGKYIGSTSTNKNELLSSTTTQYSNTISIDNGNAFIKGTSRYLRYNGTDGRFRYYTSSSQQDIQLYKYEPATAATVTTYNSNPVCSYMVYVDGNMQNGTVTVDPATATTEGAAIGSTVTLTATPATGYHFGRWNVTSLGTSTVESIEISANNTFVMPTNDVNVSADFWIDTLTIDVVAVPTVGGDVTGAGEYEYGTAVTLTATPSTYYIFTNWTVNDQPVSTDATITFNATQDSTFKANFTHMEKVASLVVDPVGGNFTSEDNVTITITCATPNSTIYYTLDGTDPVVPGGRNVTGTQVYSGPINITSTTTLKAVAAATDMINSDTVTETYRIVPMRYVNGWNTANGTVSYNPAKDTAGATITVSATPDQGYHFASWHVFDFNGTDVTVTNNTFTMPDTNVYVDAIFEPDTFSVTFVLNDGHFVNGYTPISRYWYKQQDANLPTAADMEYEGHSFDGWYENANFEGNSWTSVPDTAKSNKTYYAKWNVNSYDLTINYVDANGQTLAPAHTETLQYGASYNVSTPDVATYMPDQTVVSGNMGTAAVTVNVIYTQIVMNAVDNQTVCTGSTTTAVEFSLPTTLTQTFPNMEVMFEKNIDNISIGIADETYGNIAAFTAVNAGTEPVVTTITVTPLCTLNNHAVRGVPQTFTITVTPKHTSEFSETVCDNYYWATADTTIVDEGSHDYVHVFANQYGCDSTVTLHLTLYKTPTSLTTTVTPNTSCVETAPNGAIAITAPTGDFEYSINGTDWQTTTEFANLAANDYSVYVRPLNSECAYTENVTVTDNVERPLSTPSVSKAFYCTDEDVTLSSTGSSTGSEFAYAWSGPNGFTSTETSPVLANPLTSAQSGTYVLAVTNTVTNCVTEASVDVVVNTPTTSDYLFTITTHGDAYANIDLNETTVTPVFATPEVHHFQDGANVNYTVVNNAAATYDAVGDYTITWTATDECGNEVTTTQVLHVTQNTCPVAADVDGNTYPAVQLAGKCWMAKNLRTTKYSDGRAVNNLMVYENIMYPNTTANLDRYGYLYDWTSAMDAENGLVLDANNNIQGICPTGWHMPNGEDFMNIAGTSTATDMFDLRYNHYWLDGGGNNSTDYSLLPGGCYNENAGRYENLIGNAYLWGVNTANPTQPRVYWADCKCYMWQVNDVTGGMGYSVRCIKD